MKSIVSINTPLPTVDDYFDYLSGESLRDYDIAVFSPAFPRLNRIPFDAGGSCLTIEDTNSLTKAILHWRNEFDSALKAGKTLFFIMDSYEDDLGASGSTMKARNQRTYSTFPINNYQSLPFSIDLTNAKGRKITTADSQYKGLYDAIKNITSYKVIINTKPTKKIFATKDGAVVGAVIKLTGYSGSMVLLPHFDFDDITFYAQDGDEEAVWSESAIKISGALVGQIVAIDKAIKGSSEHSPPPNWVEKMQIPGVVTGIDQNIASIDSQISALKNQREEQVQSKSYALEFTHLLYETGKTLEKAIEKTLRLLGYTAETLEMADLEIDHVIVGPSGKRMIGESEGKDNSAIDITKFRQLESNIGEDFERDEVTERAKGILFGNGFRLTIPNERDEQFTQKSVTNAKRLGSSLVRTADLYPVAVYLLDHPSDEAFKTACRSAIEETVGGIVEFPGVPGAPA